MSEQLRETASQQENYADIDFIRRLRREHLQTMIRATNWLFGAMLFAAFFPLMEVDIPTLHDFWVFVPLLVLAGFCTISGRILDVRREYLLAAHLYITGLLVTLILALALAPNNWTVLAFTLPVIASASGLLLPGNSALALTGLGMVALLPFVVKYPPGTVLTAEMLAALAALIAHATAGGLYTMADYSTKGYLIARKRADDFFESKERLRIALAREDWLNEELRKTNSALEKRAVQLQASSEVSRQAASILTLDVLLRRVVTLIQSRFGYYFVGIWLPTKSDNTIELHAGSRIGTEILSLQDLHIPLDTMSIIANVFKSGAARLVNDISEVSDFYALSELPSTQAVLALPLHFGDEIIGVLDIQSEEVEAFAEDDRVVFQTLADQISVAIRNARLYGAEQSRRRLAESLQQSGRALSSTLDLREVTNRILELLDAVVPYERGLVLIQEDNHLLRSVARRGFPDDAQERSFVVPIRAGDVFRRIADSREPVLIADVTADASFRQMESLPLDHSWLGVPLIAKDRVIGMISLTRHEVGAFAPDDAQVVLAFAGQAAIAMENAGLYDQLTRFNEELERRVQERTEELNTAYNRLEKLDRNKTDFIDVAAHELRTPLTVIKGYAQLLQIKPVIREDTHLKSVVEGILAGTERLHKIVNSMLDVAKIDSQVLSVVKRDMHMIEIFERLASRFESDLKARHLTLTVLGVEDLPIISADPGLLYKVFEQILGNALKYTPDGGHIEVVGKIVQTNGGPPVTEVVVRDTGIGIDPGHQELIFEKFYQTGEVSLHSSGETKFKAGGPGLGLAIAKGIIQAHGGRIWVESPGCDEETCPGSSFHVEIPVE